MAYVRLTSLAVLFFLAASVMLNVKKTEGANIPMTCGPCLTDECWTPGCEYHCKYCKNSRSTSSFM
uniref:Cyclotide n=1 Tax=Clitoria ternatea TaxID=43366 RepID=A0A7G5F3A0_CLITE|nr:cyclotide precursor [Clitoria ternatea]